MSREEFWDTHPIPDHLVRCPACGAVVSIKAGGVPRAHRPGVTTPPAGAPACPGRSATP